MGEPDAGPWLLLIHQILPHPGYFRVKTWRKLQKLSAVAIKNFGAPGADTMALSSCRSRLHRLPGQRSLQPAGDTAAAERSSLARRGR